MQRARSLLACNFTLGRHLVAVPPTTPNLISLEEHTCACAPTRYSLITNNTRADTLPQRESIQNVLVVTEPRTIRLVQPHRQLSSLSLLPPFLNTVTFNTTLDPPRKAQASLRYRQQANKETSCRAESEETRRPSGNWCYCMLPSLSTGAEPEAQAGVA